MEDFEELVGISLQARVDVEESREGESGGRFGGGEGGEDGGQWRGRVPSDERNVVEGREQGVQVASVSGIEKARGDGDGRRERE